MKKSFLIGLATLISVSAFAAREDLGYNNLKDIIDTGVQEKVRLYLDQPISVVYKIGDTDFSKSLENGDILNTTVDNFRTFEIDAKTKGKIVSIQNNENNENGDIFVKFDEECEYSNEISCSYKFTYNGDRYILSDVPERNGLTYVEVESGIFKLGNAYKEVHLKVNITNVHRDNKKDVRKAGGVK